MPEWPKGTVCPEGTPSELNCKRSCLLHVCSIYILKSLKDQKFYYGSCENLEKRLSIHNSGKVRSTKSRMPLILHYLEEYGTRAEAQKREYYFKSIDGYNWLRANKII